MNKDPKDLEMWAWVYRDGYGRLQYCERNSAVLVYRSYKAAMKNGYHHDTLVHFTVKDIQEGEDNE